MEVIELMDKTDVFQPLLPQPSKAHWRWKCSSVGIHFLLWVLLVMPPLLGGSEQRPVLEMTKNVTLLVPYYDSQKPEDLPPGPGIPLPPGPEVPGIEIDMDGVKIGFAPAPDCALIDVLRKETQPLVGFTRENSRTLSEIFEVDGRLYYGEESSIDDFYALEFLNPYECSEIPRLANRYGLNLDNIDTWALFPAAYEYDNIEAVILEEAQRRFLAGHVTAAVLQFTPDFPLGIVAVEVAVKVVETRE